MSNALWLLFALPTWYFPSLREPLAAGALTLIPALGVFSLIAGVVLGLIRRERKLFLFFIPFAASQLFVVIAGLARGKFTGAGQELSVISYGFLACQVIIAAYLIYVVKYNRASAVALAVFSLSYASFAMFIAAMSFQDTWL